MFEFESSPRQSSFCARYFYKWKGVQLVKEDEENIGQPDEQYIETDLLPGYLAQAWKRKQVPPIM